MIDSREKLCPFRYPAKVGAVVLALSAAAGPAGASTPTPLSPSIGRTGRVTAVLFKYEDLFGRSAARPKSFKRIDIDGNQALSPEELQRAFGSGWQSVFESLDLNADGRVTREEVRPSGSSAGRSTSGKGNDRGQGAGSRGNEASGSGGSHGQGSSSGKSDNRGGTAGKGGGNASGSGGSRGRK